jgi:PAS domain S-box-containing protein
MTENSRRKFKLLIIEDDQVDQMATRRFIENQGLPYDYIFAGSIAEAQKALVEHEFDAVLADYTLGDGTIPEIFNLLVGTPFVVVTGSGDEEAAVEVMKSGAADYLIKDSSGDYLTIFPATIEKAIQRQQVEDELARYRDKLEDLVAERTAELQAANAKLHAEIRERKQAEEKIDRANREWEDIFQAIGHPTVILDPQFKIMAANRATLLATGLEETEIIGKPCFEIFHGPTDAKQPDCCPLHRLHRSGKVETAEMEIETLGGWYLVSCTPVFDDLGNLEKIIHITTDVTARKQADQRYVRQQEELEAVIRTRTQELSEKITESEHLNLALSNLLEDAQAANDILEQTSLRLTEANQELEAFTYSVSHDLRAPLRAVGGFSQILRESYAEYLPEEATPYLDRVIEGSLQMDQLIKDLLNLSRVGRAPLNIRRANLGEIVDQVVNELSLEQSDSHFNYVVDEFPDCMMDPALFKQVYTNLISNAIKFSAQVDGPEIHIGVQGEFKKGQDEIVYYVRDNGVGFEMKYIDKLFGVFQRLHPDEKFEGTGVGLAIVRRIVHRHGGRVWAEGELNNGATFYFSLPGLLAIE